MAAHKTKALLTWREACYNIGVRFDHWQAVALENGGHLSAAPRMKIRFEFMNGLRGRFPDDWHLMFTERNLARVTAAIISSAKRALFERRFPGTGSAYRLD